MKKLLLLIILAGITSGTYAQKGFRAGVKGGYNSTWLFNKNVSDAGDNLDFKSSFGSQFGIMLGYNFTEKAGITVDVLSGTVKQKYTHRLDTGFISAKFESDRILKVIDIPVLFHFGMEGGVYLEVGPQLSLISSGERNIESFDYSIEIPGFGSFTGSVPGDHASIGYTNGSYVSAVIGIGYDIKVTDQIAISPGLRFTWGLGDVFEESGYKKDVDFPAYNPGAKPSYEPTNAATGGLHLGVSYKFSKD